MSLLLLAHDVHPRYRLIIAANRDEYHHRETESARWWDDAPDLLASRDLEADGCWLGVTRGGRFAAITNYRNPKSIRNDLRSRGLIVRDFLESDSGSLQSLRALSERPRDYNLFATIMSDGAHLGWCSNQVRGASRLSPGIYGLSNHLLGTPWQKVTQGKESLAALLELDPIRPQDLFALLDERTPADDDVLPRTGVSTDCERWLSARFIVGETFGTRSSTVIMIDRDDNVEFVERNYDRNGVEVATARFVFHIEARTESIQDSMPAMKMASSR